MEGGKPPRPDRKAVWSRRIYSDFHSRSGAAPQSRRKASFNGLVSWAAGRDPPFWLSHKTSGLCKAHVFYWLRFDSLGFIDETQFIWWMHRMPTETLKSLLRFSALPDGTEGGTPPGGDVGYRRAEAVWTRSEGEVHRVASRFPLSVRTAQRKPEGFTLRRASLLLQESALFYSALDLHCQCNCKWSIHPLQKCLISQAHVTMYCFNTANGLLMNNDNITSTILKIHFDIKTKLWTNSWLHHCKPSGKCTSGWCLFHKIIISHFTLWLEHSNADVMIT